MTGPKVNKDIADLPTDSRSAQRETNIELVRKLQVRGIIKPLEIKRYFEERLNPPIYVTERSILRYKSIIRRRMAARIRSSEDLRKPVEQLAMELRDNYLEVTREAWVIHSQKKTSARDKLKALEIVANLTDNWIDRLQKLGLVYQPPAQVQMLDEHGNPTSPQVNINVEKLENLNAAFIAFFKAQHQDPIGATGDTTILERTAGHGGQPDQAAGK